MNERKGMRVLVTTLVDSSDSFRRDFHYKLAFIIRSNGVNEVRAMNVDQQEVAQKFWLIMVLR